MKKSPPSVTVASPTTEYVVGDLIGETKKFRIYKCTIAGFSSGIGLLKIASEPRFNPDLDREAYILNKLKAGSEFVKTEAERTKDTRGDMGYGNFFPHLKESFVSKDQQDRRVNIFDVSHVCDSLLDLAPLGRLLTKEFIRVDPMTSAWIMGKLLKMLDFIHTHGITAKLNGENILINRDRHVVMIFDWTDSVINGNGEPPGTSTVRDQISHAAQEVILALGGDLRTKTIPSDDQLPDEGYQLLLQRFSRGMEKNAGIAHTQFYEYIRSIWPGEFHPFTAYPVD